MKNLVNLLKKTNKTISSMESCTGGLLANEITNINGSSLVFKLGLVTYSNEFKMYFGVSKDTIDKYSVYSKEVADEMAFIVSSISKSDYGVGITGQLGAKDPNNDFDNINLVFVSIYEKEKNKYYSFNINPVGASRIEKKICVINFVKEKLYEICK